MISFVSLWRAFRVASSMPPPGYTTGYGYGNGTNADLTCDEDGALWVRLKNPFTPIPGSSNTGAFMGRPETFRCLGFLDGGLVGGGTGIALQSLTAFSDVPGSYLLAFNSLSAPTPGDNAYFSWPVGTTEVPFQLTVGWPLGLQLSTALYLAFSSTPSQLTPGPLGWYQGIYSVPP